MDKIETDCVWVILNGQKWTKMDKIETDCVWVILKKGVVRPFFKFMSNRIDKGRFFSESSCL